MFNSKPIITRREEDKNTPLGVSPQTMELLNRLGEARNNLHEIMKTIYLDK